jgi:hypothetical protein
MTKSFLIGTALTGLALLSGRSAFSQQGQNAPPPEKVPFCELAANSEKYDGRVVLTEAVAHESIHTIVLYDPLCSDHKTRSGQSLSAQPTSFEPYKPGIETELVKQYANAVKEDGCVRVVLIGRVNSSRGAYGPQMLLFEIAIRSFVSVYKIPEAERDTFGLRKMGPPPIPGGK